MSEATLERARILMDLHRHADAETLIRQAAVAAPQDAETLRLLSICAREQGRPDEAAELATGAVSEAPDDVDCALALSRALLATGDRRHLRAAQDAALAATRLAPDYWGGHHQLAMALREGRRPRRKEALDAAYRAVDLAPDESTTHNLYGMCLSDLRLNDHAEQAYREALRLNPASPAAMNNLALLEMERGKLGAGAELLKSGLGHDAQGVELRANLDLLLFSLARRLSWALFATILVLVALVGSEAPYVLRAAVGAALLGTYGVLTRRVLHRLPRGAAAWIRGIWWRQRDFRERLFLAAFVVLSAGTVAVAFLPHDLALVAGGAVLTILRIAGVLAIAAWIVRRLAAVVRRG